MREVLCLAELGKLANGAAEKIIDAAIDKAVADIDDRGADGKPRKVTIEVSLTKNGENGVSIEVEARASVPAYRTGATHALPMQRAGSTVLAFQPSNAERADQDSFLDKE